MTETPDLSQAFSELLDEVRAIEQKLLSAEPPLQQADLLDGYRLAFSLLRVATDAYIWGDKDNPNLVDVIKRQQQAHIHEDYVRRYGPRPESARFQANSTPF